jgi:integrase
MPGRQAQTLSSLVLRRMLRLARQSPHPERNTVIVLLSVKAGLWACEIARLEWPMVLDAEGRVSDSVVIEDRIAKRGTGRRIPLHPELPRALVRLAEIESTSGSVIRSTRGGALLPNSIVNWFVALFARLRVEGCSSHSGRRTFITAAARNVHRVGGSLRDVQLLAGHRSIQTTQSYIDGDTRAQHRLVALI